VPHRAGRCIADPRKFRAARRWLTTAESSRMDKYDPWTSAVGTGTRESRHRAVQTEAPPCASLRSLTRPRSLRRSSNTCTCGIHSPRPALPPAPIRPGPTARQCPSPIIPCRTSPEPHSGAAVRPGDGQIAGIQPSHEAKRPARPQNLAATTQAPPGTCFVGPPLRVRARSPFPRPRRRDRISYPFVDAPEAPSKPEW
jgi:hypothetical protein